MKSSTQEIKAWTIYLWQNGDKYEGAAPVVTKDGVKEIYRMGWEVEVDPEAKRNEERHKVWRAKIKVKNLLNNTLNVINWYGKKVLDREGNIDTEMLRYLEAATAQRAAEYNLKIEQLNKGKKKKLKPIEMNDLYKIRKFPTEEITLKNAIKYGLR